MIRGGNIYGLPNVRLTGEAVVDMGGGPTAVPVNSIMTIMMTSLDGNWKCPLAYFIISSKFKGPVEHSYNIGHINN